MKNIPLPRRVSISRLAICLTMGALAAHAVAGEYFERNGIAIQGYDPVAYFQMGRPVQGSPDFKLQHKGSEFHFSSQANRNAFAADPDRYSPQYNGFCAFGMASGYKAAIQPTAFTVVNGKLYLNYNADIQKKWGTDVSGYVKKADGLWPETSRQAKVVE